MTGRRTGRALLAAALLLGPLLTAGCGVRPSVVITGRPAVSGPAQGVGLYLVAQGELVLVLRPVKGDSSPNKALALLAAGPQPNERGQGLTSDVPTGLNPVVEVTPAAGRFGGLTVRVTGTAQALSPTATDQIICTVSDAAAQAGLVASSGPVTIVGSDGAQPARRCPAR
ncbi:MULTISPECIES: hypothetical protein [Micromonospora]|uniref:hypothetical protein n=1 Tax=Micromonospora TaxID=1873 RepID=UPI0024A077BC|nr:hypothetical protein [Micromonospora sp. NBRC 107095]GLZ61483.1 hypothetical protein Misp05_50590 [Micromonospora sp. NBRC 107095]